MTDFKERGLEWLFYSKRRGMNMGNLMCIIIELSGDSETCSFIHSLLATSAISSPLFGTSITSWT